MATRFWVGGTGNWDASTTTNWAATSGGLGGASVPTSTDTVTFDTLSNATTYTVTVTATADCSDISFTNPLTGALTFAGSSTLNVYGNFTVVSTITRTFTGAINFKATATGKTITANSITFASLITFDGVGGAWTLQDNFNNGTGANQNFVLTNGTLDTNGKTVTCSDFNISGTATRVCTLGASAINCQFWTATTVTSLTFNANTSTITTANGPSNVGTGLTYNNFVISSAVNTSTFSGDATYANLTRTGGTNKATVWILNGDHTVTSTLTINGNSVTSRCFVRSSVTGTARTLTAAVVTVSNADFMDITGAGAGSWNLSAITGKSGDGGGNSGIIFTTPANQYYKIGASANWSTTANWFLATNGGGGAGRVPLPQDTAIFDANSITAGSVVITQDMPRIGSVNWTGVTNTPTWTTSTTCSFFGSITLVSGMTLTASTQAYTYQGRGSSTIDCGTRTWEKPITIDAPSGTLSLAGNFNMGTSRRLAVTSGTFSVSASNYVISVGTVTVNGGTLTLGTNTHLINGTGTTTWNVTSGTITAFTGIIKFTDTSTTAITFVGGGKTYGDVWWARGASTASNTVTGSNTFTDFKDTGTTAHSILFTVSTTQTVTTFAVSGSSGNLITLNSTDGGTDFNLVKNGGGTVSCDYLNIQNCDATPGTTWYAGANSVDNQGATGGTGWIFTVPPAGGGSSINTKNGLAYASIKTVNGLALSSVKSANGLQ